MKKLHILSFLFSVVTASITQNVFTIGQDNQVCYEIQTTTCSQPTNVSHSFNSLEKCNIIWDEMTGASKYDVSYRVKGSTEWDRLGAFNNYATIRNLSANTVYQYRVRSYCGTWDFDNATEIREFNTAHISSSQSELTGHETGITSISPSDDVLNIEFSTEAKSDVELSVRDVKGNIVYKNDINNVEGLQSKAIDVSNLEGGYYMVVMQSAQTRVAKKVVITK